jgi:hypothetical protein
MHLHFEHPNPRGRCIWLRMRGPGRIAIQSAFGHIHDEGAYLSAYSAATSIQW